MPQLSNPPFTTYRDTVPTYSLSETSSDSKTSHRDLISPKDDMNDKPEITQKAGWPEFKMPDLNRIEIFNGEDAATWVEQLKLQFTGKNVKLPRSEYSHVFMSTIHCKLSRSVKKFMRSQGSIIQEMLAKDNATEADLETIINILIEEYPAEDEEDEKPDPHTELSALSQKKEEDLKEYIGRA